MLEFLLAHLGYAMLMAFALFALSLLYGGILIVTSVIEADGE